MPSTRAEKQEFLGHVVQLDIHDDLSVVATLRKSNEWFYLTAEAQDIQNERLKKQFTDKASAARKQQIHEYKVVQGETEDGPADGEPGAQQPQIQQPVDHVEAFRSLMQGPFERVFSHHKFTNSDDASLTLAEWYDSPIHCFSISAGADDEELRAEPRDDLDGAKYLHEHLIPHMKLPKYMKNLPDVPWIKPTDIQVVKESHDIHLPLHPTLCKHKDQTFFLKLASAGDEHAVKREVNVLHELAKKDLAKKGLRHPSLEGLVTLPSTPNSHDEILGFMLSLIPQPSTPLTKLISDDISATKRKRWASESEKMVSLLHEHGIVWIDAKADNFIVDKSDELWMIDFGGGMTVGWMDPKKYGTVKGDDEATDKIVTGLKDPASVADLVWDTDEKTPSQQAALEKKRSRGESEGESEGLDNGRQKKRRQD